MFNCECVRMFHQCDICGKTLSRKEHLYRHINNVHGEGHSVQSIPIVNGSLSSNSSTTEDDMYTDDEMEGQSVKSYTDDETGEETEEEHHTLTDQESIENYEESEKEDSNPWEFILDEVYQKMDPIRDASVDKTMQANGITYEEATKHVYDALMPEYTRELMKIYIKYLRLLKGLQRDSTHRKIWKTIKRLIEEEGYDEDESIDAAVNQRKFLLQRMLTYADVMDNTNTDIDHE